MISETARFIKLSPNVKNPIIKPMRRFADKNSIDNRTFVCASKENPLVCTPATENPNRRLAMTQKQETSNPLNEEHISRAKENILAKYLNRPLSEKIAKFKASASKNTSRSKCNKFKCAKTYLITQKDFGVDGFVISKPGRYKFCED